MTGKIVFLGWGSLVWDPRELRTNGCWKKDGPYLPIEFAKISRDKRLTLVLYPNTAKEAQTLWAFASCNSLKDAIRNLACRERTDSANIGFIDVVGGKSKSNFKELVPKIKSWALNKQLDAVIWTDLKSDFEEKTKQYLNPENVVKYLRGLDSQDFHNAEKYVRNAPLQIRTSIRSVLEEKFGWSCSDDDCKKQRWIRLMKDFEETDRVIRASPDDSFWVVVPNRPANFGHLLIVSWKSRGSHDIVDENLFEDSKHMQNLMNAAHELASKMMGHLTSNGKANGKRCEKVYIVSECETPDFPFHFHLIPRFRDDNKGHFYLFEKEIEEMRWMIDETNEKEKCKDGLRIVRKTEASLQAHKRLISSNKWARSNEEREKFVRRIGIWAKQTL